MRRLPRRPPAHRGAVRRQAGRQAGTIEEPEPPLVEANILTVFEDILPLLDKLRKRACCCCRGDVQAAPAACNGGPSASHNAA